MDAPQRHIDDGRGLWRYAERIDVRRAARTATCASPAPAAA